MLNISGIQEGFVLDHIQAGMSLQIYHDLKLDQLDCTVAIIKNAKSNKMGKKDILKVECPIEALDLDILGFIDHNITVNVIKDSKIVEKKELHMPKQVKNVIRCKNPRCITSIEQELDQIFLLTDEAKEVYLSRPWRPYAQAVFIQCELGKHILPAGWNNWGKKSNESTVFYAEYQNKGEGADTSARVPYAKQLKDVSAYQPEEVLKGEDGWNPVANGNVLLSNLKR